MSQTTFETKCVKCDHVGIFALANFETETESLGVSKLTATATCFTCDTDNLFVFALEENLG